MKGEQFTVVITVSSDSQVYDTLPEVLEGLPFVESVDFVGPGALVQGTEHDETKGLGKEGPNGSMRTL